MVADVVLGTGTSESTGVLPLVRTPLRGRVALIEGELGTVMVELW